AAKATEAITRSAPGEVVRLEYRYRTKNGEWRSFEGIGTNLLHDPAVQGIVVNSRDITDRKRMEEELRDSEEYLKQLFECAPDAIYLNDSEGRFVDGNRAAEEMIGYPKPELIGKSILSLGLIKIDQIADAARV